MKTLIMLVALAAATVSGQYANSASGSTIAAAEINSKPTITTGSGAPAGNCTASKDLYVDGANAALYFCDSTNHWSQVPPVGTIGGVTITGTPAAGKTIVLTSSTAGSWQTPAAGGQAAVYTPVTYSATPVFTAASNTGNSWAITLTGNVTSSTLVSSAPGQLLNFKICQDATGGRTFAWPTGFSTAATISPVASACTKQSFFWDGTNANPTSNAIGDSGPSVIPLMSAPGSAPPSGFIYTWCDATGLFCRWENSAGTIFQSAKELTSGNIRKAGGPNAVDSAAAAADIVGLFSTCSGTQYLGADGACHTASASSTPYSAWSPSTSNVSMSGTAATIYTFSSVPAIPAGLGSGSCLVLNYLIWGSTSQLTSVTLWVDSTQVLTTATGIGGPSAGLYTIARYCNNSGVQNAQTFTIIDAGYVTSLSQGTKTSIAQYANYEITPTGIDWSTTHTITIKATGFTGNANGVYAFIN
jgi:hypothetical protein